MLQHIDKDDRSEPWIGTGGGHISAKGGADAVEFGRRLLGDYSHLLGDTKVIRVRPRSTKKKRCMDTMERILTGMEGANLCNIVTEEIETRKESNESLTMDIAEQAPLLRAFFNRWWDYMRDTHDDSEKMNQLNQEMQEYKLPKHRDIRIGIKNELKPGHVVDVYQVCKAHGVEPPEVFGRWHEYTSRLLMEVWYGPLLFLKTARRLLLGRALGEMRHEIDQMPEKDVAEILVNICHDSAVTALLLYFRVYDITRDEWVPCLDNVRVELFQSTCDPEARFVRLGHGNVVLKVPGCGASHPECPEMCGLVCIPHFSPQVDEPLRVIAQLIPPIERIRQAARSMCDVTEAMGG